MSESTKKAGHNSIYNFFRNVRDSLLPSERRIESRNSDSESRSSKKTKKNVENGEKMFQKLISERLLPDNNRSEVLKSKFLEVAPKGVNKTFINLFLDQAKASLKEGLDLAQKYATEGATSTLQNMQRDNMYKTLLDYANKDDGSSDETVSEYPDDSNNMSETTESFEKPLSQSRFEWKLTMLCLVQVFAEIGVHLALTNPIKLLQGGKLIYKIQRDLKKKWLEEFEAGNSANEGFTFLNMSQEDAMQANRSLKYALAAYDVQTLMIMGLDEVAALLKKKLVIYDEGSANGRLDLNMYRSIELLTKIPKRDIILLSPKSSLYRPAFFLAVDHANKCIVLAIRGTLKFQDILVDLVHNQVNHAFFFEEKESFDKRDHSHVKNKEILSISSVLALRIRLRKIRQKLRGKAPEVNAEPLSEKSVFVSNANTDENVEVFNENLLAPPHVSKPRSQEKIFEAKKTHEEKEIVEVEGRIHQGFLLCAKKVDKQVNQKIQALMSQHKDYKVIVTGHSLGAAVASLLVLLWTSDEKFRMHKNKLKCYAFAAPACMSKNISQASFTRQMITSFVNNDDIVPRLSYSSFFELHNSMLKMAQLAPNQDFKEIDLSWIYKQEAADDVKDEDDEDTEVQRRVSEIQDLERKEDERGVEAAKTKDKFLNNENVQRILKGEIRYKDLSLEEKLEILRSTQRVPNDKKLFCGGRVILLNSAEFNHKPAEIDPLKMLSHIILSPTMFDDHLFQPHVTALESLLQKE